MVDANLLAVRAAVVTATALANTFHVSLAKVYDPNSATPNIPIFQCNVRFKKPRPFAFEAGNVAEWGRKRRTVIKFPMDIPELVALGGVIKKGWVIQLSAIDGDPVVNNIGFTVTSALGSQFAAEREVTVESEVIETPRIS